MALAINCIWVAFFWWNMWLQQPCLQMQTSSQVLKVQNVMIFQCFNCSWTWTKSTTNHNFRLFVLETFHARIFAKKTSTGACLFPPKKRNKQTNRSPLAASPFPMIQLTGSRWKPVTPQTLPTTIISDHRTCLSWAASCGCPDLVGWMDGAVLKFGPCIYTTPKYWISGWKLIMSSKGNAAKLYADSCCFRY